MSDVYADWESVIGLEVHVELNTKSKLFSCARNRFGDEPNTNISPVCTGMPGSLPVLNKEAVRKAILFGCAVQGEVALLSRFDRKSYFYPDSPRNFQITQFEHPIVRGGHVKAIVQGAERYFELAQAHIEDDAGMLKHFGEFAGVDYNRAGVPLIEIVSKPCMFCADDAVAYATALVSLLDYIGISDCNMEEGSVRFDVNVSVRPRGSEELRNKVEIKNMNSFAFMAQALEAERCRQIDAYLENPNKDPKTVIPGATYRWDPEKKKTVLMRLKERAEDYKYFIEPDLPVLQLTEAYINEIGTTLPELPYDKYQRYLHDYAIAEDIAAILIGDKHIANFFELAATECRNYRALSNWVTVEFAGRCKTQGKNLAFSGILPSSVAQLVNFIDKGVITGKIAKDLADMMMESPEKTPEAILKEHPEMLPMTDESALVAIIAEVLGANSQSVIDYKSGKTKALGFLVGQIMKRTQGKAPPNRVNELLLIELDK
ncbi:Aspartyl/glutamyl-tRNA(Asn/Gln) amidotransferase subunit B,aspartyl/glutamyl-tRNA amidotransferase subunit B,aspartyl/glutamyl-tRNA(Asn/Gln) amidotransferase, B subunit,GatB/GatE catalytic domain [Chlamydia poikilotherma]|uniref:Aspartyl/glutamyl-tRNA(Asn/Gln) amidotransferase subunit B n=1 Tax=Chlamydia poikilotherma TaxID=1967783 RepID=A0A3B0PM23_9CHLA|nr:Asp-tRNA(Asn)/Glu-tRNA(Gln) amidotransferase subunit GatB [Chlamydia poikilotherma]SYX08779.1 Aspartyl/glutamyl-tRNA(Asn/Gln) amidotransferase subunit B,aspartyl/glutamyl-tRNA amidotransferase subunit B,aspartyl/glutamyl-tRNA(Asn/Gln) amidotransferase, B subunit,GatB/GatE catalytic domain [Chlamydia poikilotherma]